MKAATPLRIVFLGPPGAGKGTQAVLLSRSREIPHISTGEIMRDAVSRGTSIGSKVKAYLDSGELVPDDLVIELIRERLCEPDCANGYLLDGFPRTVEQAKSLSHMLAELSMPITHLVELQVDQAVLLDRIRKRGEAGSGRSDDNEAVAQRRLAVYWEQTHPVAEHYKKSGHVIEIDGLGTVDEVHQRILDSLQLCA